MMRTIAWFASLSAYFTLLGVSVVWNVWIDPPAKIPRVIPLLVLGLPLLIMLRGLLHGRTRSYQWSALLALIYFVYGLIESAGGAVLYGGLQTIAAAAWFAGVLLYLKTGR